MHANSPRAFAAILDHARWRTVGVAVAAGIAGSALIVIPALAQTGNQPPVANDDSYAIVQNSATPLAVLANDTDPESDTLTIQSVTTPAHGLIALAAGTLTYTPTAGYLGSDTLIYTVSDGHGNTDTAIVTLTVAVTVGVPVAQDDTYNVPMNTATSLAVLSNDSDPDGQALTITTVSTPAHGTAAIVSGTSITYTPTAGYSGADTFSYTVSDGAGSTDIATVTINVTTTGNAPVVQNDTVNVVVGTSTVINVLANDSDPNGDVLTITSASTPGHGTATIGGDAKSITYVPTAAYTGADTFTYTVSDGHGNSASGTVAITVTGTPTGNAPVAQNDTLNVLVSTSTMINVLANDSDPNGDALTITSVSTPGHCTATIAGDAKSVTYVPTAGYLGADTFTYTVSDGHGNSASGTVAITVVAQNTLLAVNDTASVRVDTAKTISVLGNDVAANAANALTVSAVTTPGHGTATITGDAKQIIYTPTGGYTGTDSFGYTVAEANGGTATATVTVTIRPASTGDEDDDDHSKEDCKDGRWFHLGFGNQGLCIADANHGFLHNGRPLFPNGIFPNGLFPNGAIGNGHEDCDDDEDNSSVRGQHQQSSAGKSDKSDKPDKAALGAKIRDAVQASLDRGNNDRGNNVRVSTSNRGDDHDHGQGNGRGH